MKKTISALLFLIAAIGAAAQDWGDTITLTYRLHGQTRRFKTVFTRLDDGGARMDWTIVRNLRLWEGSYTMTPQAVATGDRLSYLMPEDGLNVTLPPNETFAMLSTRSFTELSSAGHAEINGVGWETSCSENGVMKCVSEEGAHMDVSLADKGFPLIVRMSDNPAGINWQATWPDTPQTPFGEISALPERSGGIYYAYPYNSDVMPALPAGYRVSHISHYGRHGSRWVIRDYEYDLLLDTLSKKRLTPLGADVVERVKALRDHAAGHKGELSPLGERQHRGIAERMFRRFPSLFADSARISARSSVEPRCIMSMSAFSERLKELNPKLKIERHASPGDMRFIAYSSPGAKAVNADSAAWWRDLAAFREEVVYPSRLMKALVDEPVSKQEGVYISWLLHNIAVDTQDTEPGVELLDIFTDEEAYNLWLPLNYKMYYLHANNPATGAAGPRSADALLDNFVTDIENALTGEAAPVTLRFGHDTALLRLMARMGIEGADAAVSDPKDYHNQWQDYRLAPMAANLQVIVLTSDVPEAEPLVLIRHNERPTRITGLSPLAGGYYPWSEVATLWRERLNGTNP